MRVFSNVASRPVHRSHSQRVWLPSLSLLTFVSVCPDGSLCAQDQGTAPGRSDVEAILLRLDHAFGSADLSVYQQEFQPLHRSAHAALIGRFGTILSGPRTLSRTTNIMDLRVQESFNIVHVQTRTTPGAHLDRGLHQAATGDQGLVVQEDYLMVFARHGGGTRILLRGSRWLRVDRGKRTPRVFQPRLFCAHL